MSESEKTIQEECYGTCWGAQQRIDELTQQLNLANERIKRLEEAGDWVGNWILEHKHLIDNINKPLNKWRKAKEVKP